MRGLISGILISCLLAVGALASAYDDAMTALDAGRFEDAVKLADRGLQAPGLSDLDRTRLRTARGIAYLNSGKPDKALDDFNAVLAAVQKLPQDADSAGAIAASYSFRGEANAALEHYADAVADFQAAAKADPADADYPYECGRAYSDWGKNEDAVASFTAAIKLRPDFADAVAYRGESYQNLKQLDNALADYNQALKLQPDYAMVYNDRGTLYIEMDRAQDALTDLNKAAELQPGMPVIYLNRAAAHRKLQHWQAAIDDLKKVLTLVDDPEAQASIRKDIADIEAEKAKASQ